jgi:membrane-associated phospholipid phosphatase
VLAGSAVFAYFLMRGLTEGRVDLARRNADTLVAFERWLAIDFEGAIQRAIIDNQRLVDLANWIYIWGHWPFIIAVAVLLVVARPPFYVLARNSVIAAGAIGLVFFVFFPVMPPRLGVLDLTDTITTHSTSYRTLQPPALVNQYAAFPSLHVGFNLLMGIALYRATRRWALRTVAVVMPVAMAWASIATANHYVIDVVAGVVVSMAGYAIALCINGDPGAGGSRPGRLCVWRRLLSPARRVPLAVLGRNQR